MQQSNGRKALQFKKPSHSRPASYEIGGVEKAQTAGLRYMLFSDAKVRACVEKGCNTVIAEGATITRYDEVVGDGDCGYTLRDGAEQALQSVSDKDLGGEVGTEYIP